MIKTGPVRLIPIWNVNHVKWLHWSAYCSSLCWGCEHKEQLCPYISFPVKKIKEGKILEYFFFTISDRSSSSKIRINSDACNEETLIFQRRVTYFISSTHQWVYAKNKKIKKINKKNKKLTKRGNWDWIWNFWSKDKAYENSQEQNLGYFPVQNQNESQPFWILTKNIQRFLQE